MASEASPTPKRLKCPVHLYPVPAVFDQEVFKLCAVYRGRKLELDISGPTMEHYTLTALKSRIQDAYHIKDIKLTYTDEDSDVVSIDSQEEFQEALKVGKALGTLQLSVSGKEYNDYVEELHLKLSGGNHSEPMEVEQSSPASSFVKVSHSDVPMDIKYPPSIQQRTSGGHYADLACMIGSERRQSAPNKYVSDFHSRYRKGISPPPVPNPYVDSLQTKFSPPTKRLSKSTARNDYVEAIHAKLSSKASPASPSTKASCSSQSVTPPAKNQYVEQIHAKLSKMGSGKSGRGTCKHRMRKREWINSALKQESQVIVDEFQKGLNGVVEVLSEGNGRGPLPTPHGNGPIHFNIVCDGCHNMIVGARYKCGNCSDYDLCEWCEPMSDNLHPVDHIFLKVKTPGRRIGANCKGTLKPLLRKNVYHHHCHDPCSSSEEEAKMEAKRHKKMEKEKRRHHHHHHHHKREPLLETPNESTVMTAGYVTRPREQLREELIANKLRKREEKKKSKVEAKIDKLQTKLASVSVGEGKKEKEDKQKGHGKYLDCQFLTDTSYPDESVVPFQIPFEKGWLVMNSGTKKWKHVKLVFQDGYRPVASEIEVPELKPGERVELIAQYPAVCDRELPFIQSCWRLVHKESTQFGPVLWLSVAVDNQPPPTAPPLTTVTLSHTEAPLTSEDLPMLTGEPDITFPGSDSVTLTSAQDEDEPTTSFQIIRPITLEMPSAEDQLIQTFDVVETPNSVLSLASNDSFHQTPEGQVDMGEGNLDTASVYSNDSDDFVVIIPDCFDLSKPLQGYTPPVIESPFPSIRSHDSHMTMSHDSHMTSSFKLEPTEPEVKSKPATHSNSPTPDASPLVARKEFVPQRLTLKNVTDARLFRPLTLATGLMNTVSDLVSNKVNIAQTGKKMDDVTVDTTPVKDDSDEEFEDAPEAPTGEATPATPPPQPWKTQQMSDVSPLLPSVHDASQWVQNDEDDSKWCQSPDVSHLVPLRWDGPKAPSSPMEKLISMGFADRVLNQRLLDKHNNSMPMVLNELLDGCHGNTKRSGTVFV